MNLNNLTPEQQQSFLEMLGQTNQQSMDPSQLGVASNAPQAQGNPVDQIAQSMGLSGATPQPQAQPSVAPKLLVKNGQLLSRQMNAAPLGRLFGKKTVDVPLQDSTNYGSSIEAVGASKFLPENLPTDPRTGKPFITKEVFNEVLKAHTTDTKDRTDSPVTDPGKIGFARAFLKERSPETVDAFEQMVQAGSFTEKMFSQLPSYATGRQDFFTPQGVINQEGTFKGVTFNSRTGEYVVKELPTGGELPGKSRAATSDEADFFGKAETLNNTMGQIAKLYSDDKVGPFAGRVGRAVDVYTPFTNTERSSLRNYAAKMFNNMVYLRSGKQINQEEANRMAEEFMNINNTPGAFRSAFDSLQNEFVWLVDNKRQAMKQGLVANAEKFAPGIRANQRVQLNGTQALDGFLSQYDQAHKTGYSSSTQQDMDSVVKFLNDRNMKVTTKNMNAAKAYFENQKRKNKAQ